jgi:hypothetical protein
MRKGNQVREIAEMILENNRRMFGYLDVKAGKSTK